MVHFTSTQQISCDELTGLRNIDFRAVPVGLVEQLDGHPHTHADWLKWASWANCLPNIWNVALVDKDQTVRLFVYGTWDPLFQEMRVIHLTAYPGLFRFGGETLRRVQTELMLWARELSMKRVYWETHKWRAMMRKLPGAFRVLDTRLVEVANVTQSV